MYQSVSEVNHLFCIVQLNICIFLFQFADNFANDSQLTLDCALRLDIGQKNQYPA